MPQFSICLANTRKDGLLEKNGSFTNAGIEECIKSLEELRIPRQQRAMPIMNSKFTKIAREEKEVERRKEAEVSEIRKGLNILREKLPNASDIWLLQQPAEKLCSDSWRLPHHQVQQQNASTPRTVLAAASSVNIQNRLERVLPELNQVMFDKVLEKFVDTYKATKLIKQVKHNAVRNLHNIIAKLFRNARLVIVASSFNLAGAQMVCSPSEDRHFWRLTSNPLTQALQAKSEIIGSYKLIIYRYDDQSYTQEAWKCSKVTQTVNYHTDLLNNDFFNENQTEHLVSSKECKRMVELKEV